MSSTELLHPVTVVVTQRVVPGREQEFRRWQDGVNLAVARFAGYLGTEVVPPEDGAEWTVLYRFDSADNLRTWLDSPVRHELLERGAPLFAAPADQQVLQADREENVTVVVTHRVAASERDAFLAWQARLTEAKRQFPGFRGSELSPPVDGVQEEWGVAYRFDTPEHLDAWLASPERRALLDEGAEFRDYEMHRVRNPFGSWFALSDEAGAPVATPNWKSALAVLVGLYPTVMLLTLGIAEVWGGAELWQSILLGNVVSTALLTWVVMPFVTRSLRFWLGSDRRDLAGAALVCATVAASAVVFWLVTTVIWTLP